MNFKIEKGVPLPKTRAFGRPSKYPFKSMEVGDSFEVRGETHVLWAARRAASSAAHRLNLKFTCSAQGQSIRIWRIA